MFRKVIAQRENTPFSRLTKSRSGDFLINVIKNNKNYEFFFFFFGKKLSSLKQYNQTLATGLLYRTMCCFTWTKVFRGILKRTFFFFFLIMHNQLRQKLIHLMSHFYRTFGAHPMWKCFPWRIFKIRTDKRKMEGNVFFFFSKHPDIYIQKYIFMYVCVGHFIHNVYTKNTPTANFYTLSKWFSITFKNIYLCSIESHQ